MLAQSVIQNLIKTAKLTRRHTFSHVSNHKIGASVLTADGFYFGGCITKGFISGLGICAERSAINHAVVHGHYQFRALCVVDTSLTYPCGACLQFLMQFYQVDYRDIDIIIADIHGKYKITSLLELLPHGYQTTKNLRRIKKYQKV